MRLLKVQYKKAVDFAALREAGFDTISYNVPIGGTVGLRAMIDGAHAAGMRCIAWLALGVDEALLKQYPVAEKDFVDFSNEAARKAMASAVSTLLRQFPDLDGFALDYMRRRATTDDATIQTAYGGYITDAVERIAEAAEDKLLIAHVKAYVNDWLRWCQNWPQWLDEGLIEFVAPMCYRPLDSRYGGFPRHAQAWLGVADQERILPTLAIIDTSTADELLKTPDVITQEIEFFKSIGYTDLAFFDNRVTTAQLAAIAAALPENEPETVDVSAEIAALRGMLADARDVLCAGETQVHTWIEQIRADLTEMETQIAAIEEKARTAD